MVPAFCTIPRRADYTDPLFSLVAERLHGGWPGLLLEERDGGYDVLVAADGTVAQVPAADITRRLPEHLALDLMDAIEEAIEDAQESGDRERAARLESTLALLERALDEGEG